METHNYKILDLNHISLAIITNPYFHNLQRFITHKFDREEFANCVLIIGENYTYIIPELRDKYSTKKLIVYNWEQLCGGNAWLNVSNLCESAKLADEVWDYNTLNATYFKLYHDVNVSNIYPFEYYPEIEVLSNKEEPEIDVLFYGLLNERRAKILSNIQIEMYNKFNMVIALGTTVEESYRYVENSKIVLNIHAFEPWHRQEQERIGFLLGNKKCVVSELSQENYFGDSIVEIPAENMCSAIIAMLSGDVWKHKAENGYNTFKANKCIKTVNF